MLLQIFGKNDTEDFIDITLSLDKLSIQSTNHRRHYRFDWFLDSQIQNLIDSFNKNALGNTTDARFFLF